MLRQQLGAASAMGYNELVLDAAAWVAALPTTVEAFFVTRQSSPSQRDNVRQVRRAFLDEFDRDARDHPLLLYNPSASGGPAYAEVED